MDSFAPKPPSPNPQLLKTLLVLGWAFWVVMFVKYVLIVQFTIIGCDFEKHYVAAQSIAAGRNPYQGEGYLYFNYPLLTAAMFQFLVLFPRQYAEIPWDVLLTLSIAAASILFALCYRPATGGAKGETGFCPPAMAEWIEKHWVSVAALTMACFSYLFLELIYGNIDALNFLLAVAVGALLMKDRQVGAGVVLAVFCLVKLLPVLFVPSLYVAGKKRACWAWAATMAVYAAVLFATGLWRWEWCLYTDTLPKLGFRFRNISNSIAAILGTYPFPSIFESKTLYDRTSMIVSLVVLTAHFGVLAAGRRAFRRSWKLAVIFTSLSMLLVSPLLESHHLMIAFLAWGLLVVAYAEGDFRARTFWACFAVWVGVFATRYWPEFWPHHPGRMIHPYHAATLLLIVLWFLTAWEVIRLSARSASHGGHCALARR